MAGPAVDQAAWSSPWRNRAVGDKGLLTVGLLTCALVSPDWAAALVVLLITTAIALGPARVRTRLWLWSVSAPFTFIVIGALSVALAIGTPPGPILWQGGPFTVTESTLAQSLLLLTRGFAGTAAVLLLATTTPIVDLLTALRRWGIPDPLVEVAALTYRLLFLLSDMTSTIRASQEARLGYDGLVRGYRSLAVLLSSTLVRTWERARRMEDGLAGRGFEGSMRTLASPRHHSARFVAATGGMLAGLVALMVWRSR